MYQQSVTLIVPNVQLGQTICFFSLISYFYFGIWVYINYKYILYILCNFQNCYTFTTFLDYTFDLKYSNCQIQIWLGFYFLKKKPSVSISVIVLKKNLTHQYINYNQNNDISFLCFSSWVPGSVWLLCIMYFWLVRPSKHFHDISSITLFQYFLPLAGQ